MKKLLTMKAANKIRKEHSYGAKQVELAEKYGISKVIVSQIINNKRYVEDTTPFTIGEIEWDQAQDSVYSNDYSAPDERSERIERMMLLTQLQQLESIEQQLPYYEEKYGIFTDDLDLNIAVLPYPNEEVRTWRILLGQKRKLLFKIDQKWSRR